MGEFRSWQSKLFIWCVWGLACVWDQRRVWLVLLTTATILGGCHLYHHLRWVP